MTMPGVGSVFVMSAGRLSGANRSFPVVTGENAIYEAKKGNGQWSGNTFTTSADGVMNYWYVPQAGDGNVSYCVVPRRGRGSAYIRSDNFGGCEWHVLENDEYDFFAFLHVYRGNGGKLAAYTTAPGWNLIDVRRSAQVAMAGVHLGSALKVPGVNSSSADGMTWAFSEVDRSGVKPVVKSVMLNVMSEPAGLRVRLAQAGTGPYVPPR